ncbi:MAG: hypothetical protein K0R08_1060 [Solimicrobium sp.]|jgi:hypothetical protein|nr:hypothetical protein [Solimicrobium sp.]
MINANALAYDKISRSMIQSFSERMGKLEVASAIKEMESDDRAILLSKLIAIKYCRSQNDENRQEIYWEYISKNIIDSGKLPGVKLYELMAFIKNQSAVFQRRIPETFKQLLPTDPNEQRKILLSFGDDERTEIKTFLSDATGLNWEATHTPFTEKCAEIKAKLESDNQIDFRWVDIISNKNFWFLSKLAYRRRLCSKEKDKDYLLQFTADQVLNVLKSARYDDFIRNKDSSIIKTSYDCDGNWGGDFHRHHNKTDKDVMATIDFMKKHSDEYYPLDKDGKLKNFRNDHCKKFFYIRGAHDFIWERLSSDLQNNEI